MRTETYEVTTGHVYHVYCALGGSVYKCKDAVAASGWLQYARGGRQGWMVGDGFITPLDEVDVEDVDAWKAAVAAADCGVCCTSIEYDATQVTVYIKALEPGTSGNAITLDADAGNDVSGDTLEGGANAQRVLIGETDSLELVSYQASAGWERLEADVPDEGYVQFRDHNGEYVVEQRGTMPGQYYNVYAADDVRIMYRNTVLLELPGFGGTGGFQAPGMSVTIRRKDGAEVSLMECAAGNCLATVHYTYNIISDMQ